MTDPAVARRLARRYAAEKRFRALGVAALGVALMALVGLVGSVTLRGYSAFYQYEVWLDIDLDSAAIDPDDTRDPDVLRRADWGGMVKRSLRALFPDVSSRGERRSLRALLSSGAGFELADQVAKHPEWIGTTRRIAVPVSDDTDIVLKSANPRAGDDSSRKLSNQQIDWLDALQEEGRIDRVFNTRFLSSGDSREPELAGVWGATVGSALTLLVTLLLSLPVGVATAVYLEEFAARNRLTDFIEVNISNLAAVPSIVFGLLGLAVFINVFGLPRSAPLVGGLVLALMTLPTIIIASRAALASVPPSIREAALGVGASPVQTVLHHVLPLAMPGILTGTILGMARALGETAPLLLIGMVAFIVDVPTGFESASTVLPVQIYLWADSPERAFVAKTSAAILVLLAFLVTMNLLAVTLRHRFERRL